MFDLFHRIVDDGSARVRRYIIEFELGDFVRFRNVEFKDPAADFAKVGGVSVPSLWDGEKLYVGADTVIARLAAHRDVGR